MIKATKRLMFGVVVLANIAAASGCAEEAAPESTDAVQSELLFCNGSQEINRYFYSDDTYTTELGYERCLCNGDYSREGWRTRYFLEAVYSCFLERCANGVPTRTEVRGSAFRSGRRGIDSARPVKSGLPGAGLL